MNRLVFILIATVITNTIAGTQWPIKKSDDPANWDWMNCTFCEIHKTGKPHFHCGIDIDVNSGNVPVRALESGRVYEIGNSSIGIETEYPQGSGNYHRRIRYLHLKGKKLKKYNLGEKVNKGDIISVVQNSKAGWTDHLHVEFYQNYGGRWMVLNPLRNNENWTLDIPDDNYPPEINDVILEPATNFNDITSGFNIIRNSGGLGKKRSAARLHIKDRSGSSGQAFNNSKDILAVFGNIAPVVFARDAGTNCLTTSGEGLTVYRVGYSVNNIQRYQLEFDKLSVEDIFKIDKIFKPEYNQNKEDQFNGNFDYIKLYCLEKERIAPQKPVNGKISDGIWFTKCRKSSISLFTSTDTKEALSNQEALYPDGFHNLAFEAEDASGKTDKVKISVLTDNFVPFVKELEIFSATGKNKEPIYSASWEWNAQSKSYVLKVKTNLPFPESGSDILIVARASEPMSEMSVSVKLNELFSQTLTKPEISADGEEFRFRINRKYFNKQIAGKIPIELSGKDLAGNKLFGFQSIQALSHTLMPSRDKGGSWAPTDYNTSDKVHYILFK